MSKSITNLTTLLKLWLTYNKKGPVNGCVKEEF